MAGYWNTPHNYGGGQYNPPYAQQQLPHQTGYSHSQFSPPQPQYSPPSFNAFGMEPATPVLDQNQINYFFNEVNRGVIPTLASAAPELQAYPPPQPPSQAYAPPSQPYQYPQFAQYGAPSSQTSPMQPNHFQPPQDDPYKPVQDARMYGMNRGNVEVNEEDAEFYSPPAPLEASESGANEKTGREDKLEQMKTVASESLPGLKKQSLPHINPFKRLSQKDESAASLSSPMLSTNHATVQPQAESVNRTARLVVKKTQAVNALRYFQQANVSYGMLAEEPVFTAFDRQRLKDLSVELGISLESAEPAQPLQQTESTVASNQVPDLKRILQEAGLDVGNLNEAMIATLAESLKPAQPLSKELAPATKAEVASTTPVQSATAGNGHRSDYLAKLAALKTPAQAASSSQATPKTIEPATVQTQSAPRSPLPRAAAVTPAKPAKFDEEALKRKIDMMRAKAAAGQLPIESKKVAQRPAPPRTESMSSINYESAQLSPPDGSDAEVASTTTDQDAGEAEQSEEGEIVEDEIPVTRNAPANAPARKVETVALKEQPHVSQAKSLVSVHAPQHIASGNVQNSRKGIVSSPSSNSPRPGLQPDTRKRPGSAVFGTSWDSLPKRLYPPPVVAPEPVVIDISSEEDDELDEEEDESMPSHVAHGDSIHSVFQTPRPHPHPPKSVWSQQQQGSPSSTFAKPASNSPAPMMAGKSSDKARRIAQLAEQKLQIARKIAMVEQKKNLSSVASPVPTAEPLKLHSPAVSSASGRNTSNVAGSLSHARDTSSPVPSSTKARASSTTRQAALSALDEGIRSDEAQIQALQLRMMQLKQDMAKKAAEKAALEQQLESLGVDHEGMSFAQMQAVRDEIVQDHDAPVELTGVQPGDPADADAMDIDDDSTAESEEGSEEGEVQESTAGDSDQIHQSFTRQEVGEADDPASIAENRRVRLTNIAYLATRADLIDLFRHYAIQGLTYTLRPDGRPEGRAFVDFASAKEAERAINTLTKSKVHNRLIRFDLAKAQTKNTQKKKNGESQVHPGESPSHFQPRIQEANLRRASGSVSHLSTVGRTDQFGLADQQHTVGSTSGFNHDTARISNSSSNEVDGPISGIASKITGQEHADEAINRHVDMSEDSKDSDDSEDSEDSSGDDEDSGHSLNSAIGEPSESDSEDASSAEVGVSLAQNVAGIMHDDDDDAGSEAGSESDLLNASSSDSDEEDALEGETAQEFMPEEDSEEEAQSEDEEEAAFPDVVAETFDTTNRILNGGLNEPEHQEVSGVIPANEALSKSSIDASDDGDDEDFYEPSEANPSTGDDRATVVKTLVDGEGDSYYDPDEGDDADADIMDQSDEMAIDADSDSDLDAAMAAAFAAGSPGISASDVQGNQSPNDGSMAEAGDVSSHGKRIGIVDLQPGRSPQSGGGIPGLESHPDDGDAAMDVSEEGEIMSESGNDDEGGEEYEPQPPTQMARQPENIEPSPASHYDSAPPSYASRNISHLGHNVYGRAPPKDQYAEASNAGTYPIALPRSAPLGTQPIKNIADTAKFTPYESPLKGFKSYRYHQNFSQDIAGGIQSLTYSHQIDSNQPLCLAEFVAGECTDVQCPAQHSKDMKLQDQDIIRQIGTINNLGKSQEDKKRWADGLRQLIVQIRDEGVHDPVTVAKRVVEYRREFFGGSMFELDSKIRVDGDQAEEGEISE